MMSDGIGIPLEFPAPLPWLPPTCSPYTEKTKYDKLKMLDNIFQANEFKIVENIVTIDVIRLNFNIVNFD